MDVYVKGDIYSFGSKVLSFGGKIEMVFKNNFKNQEINITTFYIYIT
jgi:hypothetical protein